MRATEGRRTYIVAVGADATLLDLHLALLGAFEWDGDFGIQEAGAYYIEFEHRLDVYTAGRGSRTHLRRVLADGARFMCRARDPQIVVLCEVLRSYEVPSRRHYPKVVDTGGTEHDARSATWHAQSAARREYRDDGRRH